MCGIYAALSRDGRAPRPTDVHESRLRNRGPDYFGKAEARVAPQLPEQSEVDLHFVSTVLSLRGAVVTEQPFMAKLDSGPDAIFCWNGEAWKIGGQPVQGNDGSTIFASLTEASSQDGTDGVLRVLRSIEGPFAFVYLDPIARLLYFGRDRLGRRSLLVSRDDVSVRLSSTADGGSYAWLEVEADGIYALSLDLFSSGAEYESCLSRHEWIPGCTDDVVLGLGVFNMSISAEPAPPPLSLDERPEPIRTLRRLLNDAVAARVTNVPSWNAPPSNGRDDTRVAVLFSGGLDCTVLARLASDVLPREQNIDLINVAFENPRLGLRMPSDAGPLDIFEACPDRITGRASLEELRKTCPGRTWRFIAVNVPYLDTMAHRSKVVSLMSPHNTEMDLSIAYALYFAARAKGLAYTSVEADPVLIISPARVLLSGLGADELFGGYARHPAAFTRAGYEGLAGELKLDVSRLGKRNLGRDDRVISNWSREVRFPFLDEGLLRWAIQCPVTDKCDFAVTEDISGVEPGKRVLRLLARELGMEHVAREKKRAIQFGSRTAKMENSKTTGTMLITTPL